MIELNLMSTFLRYIYTLHIVLFPPFIQHGIKLFIEQYCPFFPHSDNTPK